MKVIVVGAGPGAPEFFTEKALHAIRSADLVLTSARLEEVLSGLSEHVKVLGVMDTVAYINDNRKKDETVCVAASGDTGFYSIAATISGRVDASVPVSVICGIGSLSYFASKTGLGYEDMKLVSLHGKDKSIVPYACYHEKVFTLSGGAVKADTIARQLFEAGLTDVTLYIGENLSLADERILQGKPADFKDMDFEDLCVVIIHNENYVNRYRTLKDTDFIRGKSPMTKEAVRNLSVAALEIEPSDVVYDIGAGTGSVTCAMAMKACESTVYAVEKNKDAVALVRENMEKTGARNIVIREALAPDGLSAFPPADKVFIGGSTGNLKEIMEAVLSANREAVFVITAVTLETISQAIEVLKSLEMETEITCASISTAQKLGNYNLMKAENPVYIIKGYKHE